MSDEYHVWCYKDSVGVELIIETGIDVTGSTTAVVNVKKPQGTVVVWDAETYEQTKLRYVTVEGDLNEVGLYYLQAEIDWGAAKKLFSETVALMVKDTFD